MAMKLQIDFVSDVVCPWCIIGLGGLDEALRQMAGDVEADIRFHPFELNPDMPPEGQDIADHIARKYGSTADQSAATRAMIRSRAADLGFTINGGTGSRIWNTFDAHRLLHWAGTIGTAEQRALKLGLFAAYFTDDANIADHAVLVETVASVGLDAEEAAAIVSGDRFAADVRTSESLWRQQGIAAVPTLVIDDRYMISGGQTAEVFERALRRIARERSVAGD